MRVCLSKTFINFHYILSHVRLSFPEDLFKEIVKAHGPKAADEICHSQNERAMMTVRANTIKTTREELMKAFR